MEYRSKGQTLIDIQLANLAGKWEDMANRMQRYEETHGHPHPRAEYHLKKIDLQIEELQNEL
jgi:hypothetical protein